MQLLTEKEEALMRCFWKSETPLFVKQLRDMQPEPLPHINTVATFVKLMENKGFLAHEAIGNSYRYYPIITQEQYAREILHGVISRYFDGSVKNLLSALSKTGALTDDDMWDIMNEMRQARRN